ncbi:unnamed protein product [Camellia sinensis]
MEELMKNQMFATLAVAAAGSATLGTALTYPLDTIKVLIQVGSVSNKQLTTAQVLDRVKTLSGHAGLYSGFGWLMLGRILGAGARFGTYEILTTFYKAGRRTSIRSRRCLKRLSPFLWSISEFQSSPFGCSYKSREAYFIRWPIQL